MTYRHGTVCTAIDHLVLRALGRRIYNWGMFTCDVKCQDKVKGRELGYFEVSGEVLELRAPVYQCMLG